MPRHTKKPWPNWPIPLLATTEQNSSDSNKEWPSDTIEIWLPPVEKYDDDTEAIVRLVEVVSLEIIPDPPPAQGAQQSNEP